MITKKAVYEILFWLFFIITILITIWVFLGNSPTIEQALLILIITLLFKTQSDIYANRTETKILKTSFIKLVHDFKQHLSDK